MYFLALSICFSICKAVTWASFHTFVTSFARWMLKPTLMPLLGVRCLQATLSPCSPSWPFSVGLLAWFAVLPSPFVGLLLGIPVRLHLVLYDQENRIFDFPVKSLFYSTGHRTLRSVLYDLLFACCKTESCWQWEELYRGCPSNFLFFSPSGSSQGSFI